MSPRHRVSTIDEDEAALKRIDDELAVVEEEWSERRRALAEVNQRLNDLQAAESEANARLGLQPVVEQVPQTPERAQETCQRLEPINSRGNGCHGTAVRVARPAAGTHQQDWSSPASPAAPLKPQRRCESPRDVPAITGLETIKRAAAVGTNGACPEASPNHSRRPEGLSSSQRDAVVVLRSGSPSGGVQAQSRGSFGRGVAPQVTRMTSVPTQSTASNGKHGSGFSSSARPMRSVSPDSYGSGRGYAAERLGGGVNSGSRTGAGGLGYGGAGSRSGAATVAHPGMAGGPLSARPGAETPRRIGQNGTATPGRGGGATVRSNAETPRQVGQSGTGSSATRPGTDTPAQPLRSGISTPGVGGGSIATRPGAETPRPAGQGGMSTPGVGGGPVISRGAGANSIGSGHSTTGSGGVAAGGSHSTVASRVGTPASGYGGATPGHGGCGTPGLGGGVPSDAASPRCVSPPPFGQLTSLSRTTSPRTPRLNGAMTPSMMCFAGGGLAPRAGSPQNCLTPRNHVMGRSAPAAFGGSAREQRPPTPADARRPDEARTPSAPAPGMSQTPCQQAYSQYGNRFAAVSPAAAGQAGQSISSQQPPAHLQGRFVPVSGQVDGGAGSMGADADAARGLSPRPGRPHQPMQQAQPRPGAVSPSPYGPGAMARRGPLVGASPGRLPNAQHATWQR